VRGALDQVAGAIDTLDDVDLDTCTTAELNRASWDVQRLIDRLQLAHGRILCAAENRLAYTGTGARNQADFLERSTGAPAGEARRRMELAAAADTHTALAEAITAGELSASTAVEVAKVLATPPAGVDHDELDALIERVKGMSPRRAKTEREHWLDEQSTEPDADRVQRRYEARSVAAAAPDDGLVTTTVVLPEYESEIVHNTLDAIAGPPTPDDTRTTPKRRADALVSLCHAYARGEIDGGRSSARILLVWNLDADTDVATTTEPAHTDRGSKIPAAVVRRLLHDATLERVVRAGSVILDHGRKVRLATDTQYAALVARDHGCRVDSCALPAKWCDVDHLVEWAHGGCTDLDDLALLCNHHHHVRHLPGSHIERHKPGGDFTIITPTGHRLHCPLPPPHQHTSRPPGAPPRAPDPPPSDISSEMQSSLFEPSSSAA
jgi:hypothetical protein